MKEEFLHYCWQTKQFDARELTTTDGQTVEIIFPGEYNRDSGPDFFNAKIKLKGQLWSGNVEIHVRASEWMKHRHQEDEAYNNVVLHVVHEADAEVRTQSGNRLPTLALIRRLDKLKYVHYLRLRNSRDLIPCANKVKHIPSAIITSWLSRLLVERLERKTALLKTELENNRGDWEETFYRHLARQFGMKVNAEPFQWLAASAPYRMIARQQDDLLRTEALLFGQSGLLPEKIGDTYSGALIREYNHLQAKYRIRPMGAYRWKFMRLRPNNFPTVRIAQLAGLLFRHAQLFRQCMETDDAKTLRSFFDIPASGYWDTHYLFGKLTKRSRKRIGPQAIDTLLVNTVAPFKFLLGQMKDDVRMKESAVALLEELTAESNRVTRAWEAAGVTIVGAGESQALLELSGNYCDKRKCLQCEIGQRIMRGRGLTT